MDEHPTIISLATRPKVVRSSIFVAIVVGTVLNLINQGDAALNGQPVVLWKIALTYLVPFCVSTFGAVMALRSND
jgi:hypothetical protein